MSDCAFEKGLSMRRKVLGNEYVSTSFRTATDHFSRPLQELITRFVWGEIWTRPGLELRVRSMLNLAIMTALNRPNELKLHLEGALRNGVTVEEIREVLLQSAVYCGIPAALDSFLIAEKVIENFHSHRDKRDD